jgi:hypothetical protein
LIEKNVP